MANPKSTPGQGPGGPAGAKAGHPSKGNKAQSALESVGQQLVVPGIDPFLLMTVVSMVLFGLLMVYSASFIYAQERTGDGFAFITKQLIVALLGFAGLFAACRIPYRKWNTWSYPIVGGAILLLVLVCIPGVGAKVGGAQRWLRLGPVNIQPAEIAKFAIILFVARQLDRKHSRLHKFGPGVLSPFLVPLPALALLLAQPDFGSAVMITAVIVAMMFVAGVPMRFLGTGALLAVGAGAALIAAAPYRMARLTSFLDPWSDPAGKGFQIIQSLVGIHNGKIFGAGLGNGKEKLFYLPEAHNDFIFAVIGEELGLLGVVAVVAAFAYLIYRGLKIAMNCYQLHGDRFGAFLATGITLALGLQGFVNMAVVLGLLPTKGLTLPFISYGGTAMLVDLFAVGVLLSIARGPLQEKVPCRAIA